MKQNNQKEKSTVIIDILLLFVSLASSWRYPNRNNSVDVIFCLYMLDAAGKLKVLLIIPEDILLILDISVKLMINKLNIFYIYTVLHSSHISK